MGGNDLIPKGLVKIAFGLGEHVCQPRQAMGHADEHIDSGQPEVYLEGAMVLPRAPVRLIRGMRRPETQHARR